MANSEKIEKAVRLVNVVPAPKIKIKIEDDQDTVCCRLCGKGFSNERALSNHARMEHIDAYSSGDPSVWTQELFAGKKARMEVENQLMKERTQQILSTMEPTNLTSFASSDVSYIIIKAEEQEPEAAGAAGGGRKRKPEKVKERAAPQPRKEKEAQPITGPFECLQPSASVAGGVCHQIFFSCCEYSAHYRDEHTRRRKGVRCQVCEAPLAPSGAPHACQVCGVGFQSIDELTDHTNQAHVKLKPFECSVCHKRFTQLGGVQQHMRMHTGDRPYPCTFCPKAFTQKSGLDQHLRIHTKVKPYRCVICDKKFCQSVHLKQHMRTHTHVAPFQCALCHKRFKQSSHLNYHLRAHNGIGDKCHSDKEIVEVEIGQDVMYAEADGEVVIGDAWEGKQEAE